jgi:hypothetical protein
MGVQELHVTFGLWDPLEAIATRRELQTASERTSIVGGRLGYMWFEVASGQWMVISYV